jgi:hypothetical protein
VNLKKTKNGPASSLNKKIKAGILRKMNTQSDGGGPETEGDRWRNFFKIYLFQ